MSKTVHYERVREHFEILKPDAALTELDPLLEKGAREERSPAWLLDLSEDTVRLRLGDTYFPALH